MIHFFCVIFVDSNRWGSTVKKVFNRENMKNLINKSCALTWPLHHFPLFEIFVDFSCIFGLTNNQKKGVKRFFLSSFIDQNIKLTKTSNNNNNYNVNQRANRRAKTKACFVRFVFIQFLISLVLVSDYEIFSFILSKT